MPGSASSTWPPAISRSPARTSACGSSSTASSTTSSAIAARPREPRATASAPAPTARSPCTSTRTSARPACTTCAASSPSSSGTTPTRRSSPPAIASASSPSSTPTHGGTLYLASEIKALFAAGVPARWDRATFFQANHFLVPPRTAPSSRASTRCRPATTCSPPAGRSSCPLLGLRLPARPTAAGRSAPTPSTPSGSGQVLDEAVRLRLRADVPVGCYLSGGIDSCACWAWRRRTAAIRSGPSR